MPGLRRSHGPSRNPIRPGRAATCSIFAAQLDDLTHEFSDQTGELLSALDVLAPDCDTLLDQGGATEPCRTAACFCVISTNASPAHGMTGQLHRADEKAPKSPTSCAWPPLRERVQVIEELRFDVDYMAINVNIRARDARSANRSR
jgi:hypothetical protein